MRWRSKAGAIAGDGGRGCPTHADEAVQGVPLSPRRPSVLSRDPSPPRAMVARRPGAGDDELDLLSEQVGRRGGAACRVGRCSDERRRRRFPLAPRPSFRRGKLRHHLRPRCQLAPRPPRGRRMRAAGWPHQARPHRRSSAPRSTWWATSWSGRPPRRGTCRGQRPGFRARVTAARARSGERREGVVWLMDGERGGRRRRSLFPS